MRIFLICMILISSLIACTPGLSTATAMPTRHLVPYLTVTASQSSTPIQPSTYFQQPTPTQVIHIVGGNETLIGIAQKYGISLQELQAANPDVNALYLQVGMQLVIPSNAGTPAPPTITPVPVSIRQHTCYPNADGSLWCLALISNEYPDPIENLSILMTLQDEGGNNIAQQIAYAPLNILPSGRFMPVAARFPAPLPAKYTTQVQLLTAIRLPTTDSRYIPATFQNNVVILDWKGLTAQISGQILLTGQDEQANLIWILAVAYDKGGNVVGFKRWEAAQALNAGEVREFEFSLSSLGPNIDTVDLLLECRP
jgi:hypothetical protein